MKVYTKSFVIAIVIGILFLELVFLSQIPLIKYADEVVALFSVLNIGIWMLQGNSRRLTSTLMCIIWLLLAVCALGLCGNIFYKICPSFWGAAVDCLGVIKSVVVFIFVYADLSDVGAARIIRALYIPSKFFLWFAVFFGIISIFVNIGMGGEVRFGLRAYSFIFEHAHILAITSMCALLMIAINEKSTSGIYLYTLLTCCCQFLTTKGPSIIWSFMIFLMFRYYVHNRKIKLWLIAILILLGISIGGYQISNYFMNASAPRALLLKYGVITANKYLPLGSGFATYGSEMAKVYYSKLYYEYGFNNLWGMTQQGGMFLNDNYWPMLIAQTGYIGGILFLGIYFKLFIKIQQASSNRMVRAILVSNYLYIMVHSLGSAALTGMEGVFLFVIFGVTLALYKKPQYINELGKSEKKSRIQDTLIQGSTDP